MLRSALLASLICLAAGGALGCHVAGCAEGDVACALPATDPATGPGSTTEPDPTSTGDPTTEPTTSTMDPSGPETTIAPDPACGNGLVEAGEDCDDGNAEDNDACLSSCVAASCGDGVTQAGVEECDDGNADSSDDCTAMCTLARCGDGVVHPPLEKCDAGADNDDGKYNGCTLSCQLGPRCGDGKINGPETCDDLNSDPSDGCLEGCVEATSCKQIKEEVADAVSGKYRVWPTALGGDIDVLVWCEMEADGGGYTYLKVDTEVDNASDKGAKAAELLCQVYGMHLLVPRTPAHLASAYEFAVEGNLAPVGGGGVGMGVDYMAILAIYPANPGATCEGNGLNSADCPGWVAWDLNQYWVTDTPVPGEPSNDHCAGCSMLYKWNPDGTLKSYVTIGSGEGAASYRFLCDIADKF
jgi:cysteine-rich repeat protein